MICRNCGNMIPDGVRFCSKCGHPTADMAGAPDVTPGQNPVAGKKKSGVMIALVVLLVVLAIAAVVLAVVFFRGLSGGGKDTGDNRPGVEKESDDDRDDDDKAKEKDANETDEADDDKTKEDTGDDAPAEEPEDSTLKNDEDDLFNKAKDKEKAPDEKENAEEDMDALFKGNGNGDYIFPDSSTRLLTDEDLEKYADDAYSLRIARNEIYARNHRLFNDPELQAYFDSKDWYDGYIEPDVFDADPLRYLTKIEDTNIKKIKQYEEQI